MAKIAVIDLEFSLPPRGGAPVDLNHHLTSLSKNHDVYLIICDYSIFTRRGLIQEEVGCTFPIIKIPCGWREFNCRILPRRIRAIVDRLAPDVVFLSRTLHLKPWISKALRGYPVVHKFYAYEVICPRDTWVDYRGRNCRKNVIDDARTCLTCCMLTAARLSPEYWTSLTFLPAYGRLVSRMFSDAHFVLVNNQLIFDVISRFTNKVGIVPGGVDTAVFTPTTRINPNPRILFPGRVNAPTKGFAVLRKAVHLLRARNLRPILTITGDKPRGSDLEDLEFIGWKSYREMPNLYRECDICVVPSVWEEPFGLTAVEAMACGKPVVASAVGGLQSIVIDGVTGYLAPPNDPHALADKLELLLRDSALRSQLGNLARQRAVEEYSWETITRRYYEPLFSVSEKTH